MTKRQENIRVKKYEKHLEEVAKPSNDAISLFFKYIKREIKDFMNSMMYQKKPNNKIEKFSEQFIWWFKLTIIFFAFKGITYWLTGR